MSACLWRMRHAFRSRRKRSDDVLLDDRQARLGESEVVDGSSKAPPSLFQSARTLAAAYYASPETRLEARCLTIALLVLLMIEGGIVAYYSELQKRLMTVLQEKDLDGFYIELHKIAGLIVCALPCIFFHHYIAGFLKLKWRRALSRKLANAYLEGHVLGQNCFYRLNLMGEIDNPDQRIGQDASEFVNAMFSLVQDCTWALIAVVTFSVVLLRISPGVCVGVMAYALFGSFFATSLFGPVVMRLQNALVQQEAGLRYTLIRTRENAESVAFFRGGAAEWRHFDHLIHQLVETALRYTVVLSSLASFTVGFKWATFAVAPMIVGPRYVRGELEFGTIAQVSMAFNSVLDGLSIVLSKLESLAGLRLRVTRVAALEAALQREERRAEEAISGGAGTMCIALKDSPAGGNVALEVCNMTLYTPLRAGLVPQTLVRNFSLRVSSGESLLIVGQSGIGKSSLLRAIAGLWTEGSGSTTLARDACFFMPQRPYMFPGTLREQLLYPSCRPTSTSDEDLLQKLRSVNLGYLLNHHSLNDSKDWASLFSLGEQQRINFARALLRPNLHLALLDEGTSACDPANEAHLYGVLGQHARSYVSVGHRPGLRRFHSHALWLQRLDEGRSPAHPTLMPMAEFEKSDWSQGHE